MSRTLPTGSSTPLPTGSSTPLPTGSSTPLVEQPWRRLHPVTPVLRSWRVLAVLLVLYAQQRGPEVLGGADGRGTPGGEELLITLGALAVAVVIAIAVSALSWRVTVYSVDSEAVRLHSGLLFKRQRSARLDRVQAVDVGQPVLARLLGFAEVRIEVAGGHGSDLRLAYLREDAAQRLRNALLAGSAGLPYDGQAPAALERAVVEVPLPRVVASLALCATTLWLLVFLGALIVSAVLVGSLAPLVGAAPAALAVLGALWTGFSGSASWRVSVAGDGLRVRHGLLATQSQTVLPGRVQALRLSQPFLWRRAGWWRLHANVAGYGRDGRNNRRGGDQHLLLPVATRAEAEAVLSLLVPQLVAELGPGGLTSGLVGFGAAGGWSAAPRRARWLDPVSWRRHGALVTRDALLLRRGRLSRVLDVVPHARTQSLALAQGPLQRRLGLATFAVHSTRGPVRPVVEHLDAHAAAVLLQAQSGRARAARALAGPERWMEASPR